MVSCSYKFSKTKNLLLSRRILKFGPQYTYPFKILRGKSPEKDLFSPERKFDNLHFFIQVFRPMSYDSLDIWHGETR